MIPGNVIAHCGSDSMRAGVHASVRPRRTIRTPDLLGRYPHIQVLYPELKPLALTMRVKS